MERRDSSTEINTTRTKTQEQNKLTFLKVYFIWLPLESWNRFRDCLFVFSALDIEWGDLCDTDYPKARPFNGALLFNDEFFQHLFYKSLISFLRIYLLIVSLLLVSYNQSCLWTSLSCSSFLELGKCWGGLCLAYTSSQASGTSPYDLQAWCPGLSEHLRTVAFPAMKWE